jgi:hypothetical protein
MYILQNNFPCVQNEKATSKIWIFVSFFSPSPILSRQTFSILKFFIRKYANALDCHAFNFQFEILPSLAAKHRQICIGFNLGSTKNKINYFRRRKQFWAKFVSMLQRLPDNYENLPALELSRVGLGCEPGIFWFFVYFLPSRSFEADIFGQSGLGQSSFGSESF